MCKMAQLCSHGFNCIYNFANNLTGCGINPFAKGAYRVNTKFVTTSFVYCIEMKSQNTAIVYFPPLLTVHVPRGIHWSNQCFGVEYGAWLFARRRIGSWSIENVDSFMLQMIFLNFSSSHFFFQCDLWFKLSKPLCKFFPVKY